MMVVPSRPAIGEVAAGMAVVLGSGLASPRNIEKLWPVPTAAAVSTPLLNVTWPNWVLPWVSTLLMPVIRSPTVLVQGLMVMLPE